MTTTLKYRDVPNDAIKLMLFPYSLEDAARICQTDGRIDKVADQISNLVEIVNKQVITHASAKAVEKTCVTCGVSLTNQASHQIPPPGFALVQNNPISGLAYKGASVPTNSPLEKVVEQNIKEITDKEHSNCQGSTAQVQHPVVPISILELDVPRTQPKPTIPYPSRLNDQKLRDKATNQMEKFFQIFHDLHFDINFADALLKKVLLNENCSAMLLKKLLEKLGDPGKFLIPCDFPGMEVDYPSQRSCRRRICQGGEVPFSYRFRGCRFRSRYKSSPNFREIFLENRSCFNRCVWRGNYPQDVIDIAWEEFVQDDLDFQYNSKSSNPTLVFDLSIAKSESYKEPIVKYSSPTLTLFGESDFFLEEIEDFLNDDSIPTGIDNSFYDPEGEFFFLKSC
nr:reverse transcriptase domain-containing protein [Tanacetum cinerariifolium]